MNTTKNPEYNFSMFQIKSAIDWLIDKGYRPYIAINIKIPGLVAPLQYASKGGVLILDLYGEATTDFKMDYENNLITFGATFRGEFMNVIVPVQAIFSIYAKENPVICVDLPGIPLSTAPTGLPEGFTNLISKMLNGTAEGGPIILATIADLENFEEIAKVEETPKTAEKIFCSAESNRIANVRRSGFKVINGGKK